LLVELLCTSVEIREREPGKKHWFQAGEEGVVMYSFSSVARDVLDGFTDPKIQRVTKIQD